MTFPRNRLKKRAEDGLYHDWFFTAIHAPGADVAALRNAGFDVLIDDVDADPARLQQAVDKGFLLMPQGRPRAATAGRPDPDRVVKAASAFPFRDVGHGLGPGRPPRPARRRRPTARPSATPSRSIVSRLRTLPPGVSRITTGVVDDDLRLYARAPRNLGMFGIRPPAWGSSVNPVGHPPVPPPAAEPDGPGQRRRPLLGAAAGDPAAGGRR